MMTAWNYGWGRRYMEVGHPPIGKSSFISLASAAADGAVFAGYGKSKRLPTVRRWQQGRRASAVGGLGDAGLEPNSMAVVYGQGDGRRQGRMLATSHLKYGNPDTLGQFWSFPATCGVAGRTAASGVLRPKRPDGAG